MSPTTDPAPGEGADEPLRYRFADVEFDVLEGELRVGGRPVVVEPRPLRLLLELLRHVGEVVTKEELLDSVWEGRPTVDHVLPNAVSKLRTALGEQGAARLQTLPRVGYRFAGPVQSLAARAPETVLQVGQVVPGREAYVLERALGVGTRNDVWRARHAKLGQVHVFKFASFGPRLSALKREYTLFRVLTQELGPREDIVRVLDTNFVQPPYFLECEDGGLSLLEWADDGGRLTAMDRDERIALFLQVAIAVGAAHSVGVLHKDIKPGNVLVRPVPAPVGTLMPSWAIRLTDFGSGRLLDPSRLDGLQLTALGMTQAQGSVTDSRSGTPMYMAPELQAGGNPTVQSDVFALGVLLWQMLAGDLRQPLVTGWEREIDDDLLRQDIAAATEGRPDLRLQGAGLLVERLKSLELRRDDRAQQQAALAQAAAAEHRWQKSRARRPWVVAAMVSLVLGLGASLWFAGQARSALSEARHQTARADSINDFMTEDLLGAIGIAGVGADGRIEIKTLLDYASRQADLRLTGQAETEVAVRGKLGRLYLMLSEFDRAEAEYRRGLARAEPQALRTDPALLRLRFDLARGLALHKNLPEARAMLEAAERDAGDALAGEGSMPFGAALARATVLMLVGRTPEAIEAARRAVVLADKLGQDRHQARFTTRTQLGDLLFRVGTYAEALKVLDEALQPPFDEASVGAVHLARARIVRARVMSALGSLEEALPELKIAHDVLVDRVGPGEAFVGVALEEIGGIHDKRGQFALALATYRQAHVGYVKHLGADHPQVRVMAVNMAIAELNLGRTASALEGLDRQRPWWVKFVGSDRVPIVQALDFERARAMTELGRPVEALRILESLRPEALTEGSPARDWPWRLPAEKGRALLRAGRRAEGLALLQPSLAPMLANGTSTWVLAAYRRALTEAGGLDQ
jgi:non-specific serine/threonine protein kinase